MKAKIEYLYSGGWWVHRNCGKFAVRDLKGNNGNLGMRCLYCNVPIKTMAELGITQVQKEIGCPDPDEKEKVDV